ncbi:hypothetical protein KGF57_004340 [Candida theae]|uniref:Vacuolar aminopeptidase I n=1 Tax=Candida theae TaxID=1198502 RepID=A0AAD5BC91_9ASCO|nr:uncharacterized protein KGF57_004340 [Candida theae]KAI5950377.1 hypothetical protein KGF57_004340 [Candida theae]
MYDRNMSNLTIEDVLAGISESLSKLQQQQNLAQSQAKTDHEATDTVELVSSKYNQEYFDKLADKYIEFTFNNPTIYHVVDYFKQQLKDAGFTYLPEPESWSEIEPGKYFTIRNGSSLAAFVIGEDWEPSKGFGAIGSHIDSLTTVLKPVSKKDKVDGYELLGVAPYAGTLGSLWWDRDLGIGGRLLVKDSKGKISQKLVDSSPHPIAHIPTLAPHFGEPSVGPHNTETKAVPVIGFSQDEEPEPTEAEKNAPLYGKHSLKLLRYIAKKANVNVEQISQWDLQLFDVQKGTRGGLNNEFIFAPRVDDRICSFAALNALVDAYSDKKVENSDAFSIVALYDNEEIGSLTRTGAKGGLLESVVERVVASENYNPDGLGVQDEVRLVYANSIILSADVNHLLNPNFKEVYLEKHEVVPNKGVALALDPNGHFATDSVGVAVAEKLAKLNKDQVQYFQIRNDVRSGSSIGPHISSATGVRTIDLGIPQLSMHSIRATIGSKDVGLGTKFFTGFFQNWRSTYDDFVDL